MKPTTKPALLIVDVQKGMFGIAGMYPFEGDAMLMNINALIARARKAKAPIIFIKHKGSPGHPLEENLDGYNIAEALDQNSNDIIIAKSKCNSFDETPLADTLRDLGVSRLVVCGMQTEFCVDTAVRSAAEKGYNVEVAEGTHATFDTDVLTAADIINHHQNIWQSAFATVLPLDKISFEVVK